MLDTCKTMSFVQMAYVTGIEKILLDDYSRFSSVTLMLEQLQLEQRCTKARQSLLYKS